MHRLVAAGSRLRHDTAVYNLAVHDIRDDWQNDDGSRYRAAYSRVLGRIADGLIDEATLYRIGNEAPAGGGGEPGQGNIYYMGRGRGIDA